MSGRSHGGLLRSRATRRALLGVAAGLAALAAGCSSFPGSSFWSGAPPPPTQPATALGSGQVKVALILPLSASGNAGVAAQSMKNAAEMALAEFNNPNLQLLVKDDGGTAPGAQQAAQQAVGEGAEIILGPLFAHSVGAAAQAARPRGVPIIAFSTDANVAATGVYLLSFLPESDVDRAVDYAVANGKRSFAALVPDNAYGSVVDAEFRQAVARKGGRVVALEHYSADKQQMQEPVRRIAEAARQADSIFIPDSAEGVTAVVQALQLWELNARPWLPSYLSACAQNGGQPVADLRRWLPWRRTEEERAQWKLPEKPKASPQAESS